MGAVRGPVDPRARASAVPRQCRVQCAGLAPAGSRRRAGARKPGHRSAEGHVDAIRLRKGARRDRARRRAACRCDRHDVARRHRLHQSRPLGQPARAVRARDDGRHFPRGTRRLEPEMGIRAARPAHRARHRRDESVHPLVRARPFAFAVRQAVAAGRDALRSVHPARPRCAELRLLPGRPLPAGRHAVRASRSRPRAARINRSERR